MEITVGEHGADDRKGVSIDFFAGACKLLARCHGNRLLDATVANTIKDHLADIEALYKSLEVFPKFKRKKPGFKGEDAYYCTCWDRDVGRHPIEPNDPLVSRGNTGGPIHQRGDQKCWVGRKKT
jgi:hypothetical protein